MILQVTEAQASFLTKKDPVLGELIHKVGLIHMEGKDDIFVSIVECIIGQMLSAKAAATIQARFEKAVGPVTPANVLATSDDAIRKCGISYSKISYIKGLSKSVHEGTLSFDGYSALSDMDVLSELRKIKGVGLWTAEMIAMFTLGRLDIFSYDDVALKNGIIKVHHLKSMTKKRFAQYRKRYHPYASIAALYYYHANDH
ncbi:MAG: DNA-3-methyladenine glycosylase 2 family protein [Firmicutes bacterium]|nr:DNA-3-methyladenine glycosylase 2 family protein [Bacillota bacterium]